ncbi:MAG: hypothetical protein AAF682_13575 [Planctomycetota bacterium]
MRTAKLILSLLPLLAPGAYAQEAPPNLVGLQMRLADAAGQSLVGQHEIELLLFDAAAGGAELWSEIQMVDVVGGLTHVTAGALDPLPADLFESPDRWLTIAIDGDAPMVPRVRLSSLPYARKAAVAQTVASNGTLPAGIVSSDQIVFEGVNSSHIANDSIMEQDLATDSVGSLELQAGAVNGAHLAPDSVGAAQLGPNSVESIHIRDGELRQGDFQRPLIHIAGGEPVLDAQHIGVGTGLRGTANNGTGVWGESQTGTGVGVYGANLSPSGLARGVYGFSESADGSGVYGQANSPDGSTHGVHGVSLSPGGIGTGGYATSETGLTYGVFGQSISDFGIGVRGEGLGAGGNGVEGFAPGFNSNGVYGEAPGEVGRGVHGLATGTDSIGVFGRATALTGTTQGVRGQASSDEGVGVTGVAFSNSGVVYGVSGTAESPDGAGVHAINEADTGEAWALYAETQSGTGAAIRAVNDAAPFPNAIHASSSQPDGTVIFAESSGTGAGTATGVYASTDSIEGTSLQGFAFGVNGTGVHGRSTTFDETELSYGVLGWTTDTDDWAVFAMGDLGVAGEKNFVQPHPTDPTRELHFASLEGNESGTYFRGKTTLVGGQARIEVPEDFRLASEEEGLTVQLTAVGPTQVWLASYDLNEVRIAGLGDVEVHYTVNGVRRGYDDFETIRPNRVFVPTYGDVPFGTQFRPGVRQLLIDSGILTPDLRPDPATAAALGWELRDAPEKERRVFEEAGL